MSKFKKKDLDLLLKKKKIKVLEKRARESPGEYFDFEVPNAKVQDNAGLVEKYFFKIIQKKCAENRQV